MANRSIPISVLLAVTLLVGSSCEIFIGGKDTAGECTFYRDVDGDDYGDYEFSATTSDCTAPFGYVVDSTDCNDTEPAAYPGATEVCDKIDNDCNGHVDDNPTWYRDVDGDNCGDPLDEITTHSCAQPDGYVTNNLDCNDTNISVRPGAAEVCNGYDDDCDGAVDNEASDATAWYLDRDGDGYGALLHHGWGEETIGPIWSCVQPSNCVADGNDCDDSDATINPGAAEVCDQVDNDCDGGVNDKNQTWHHDSDGDGYGLDWYTIDSCSQPKGFVIDDTDCDDHNADINPSAAEVNNNIDDDCDGEIDEN